MDKYSYESIQGLIEWTNEVLAKETYPPTFQLSPSQYIFDCKYFLESSLIVAKEKWDNLTYRPYITRLFLFQEQISKAAE